MPAWLKWLLDILGWDEVWENGDSLRDSRWGTAVKTSIYGAIVAVATYVAKHPIFIYAVAALVLGWILARLVSWLAARRRSTHIDWYAFSFQIPIENSGLWLTGLTYSEPFLAFKFWVTNATKRPVEITGVKGTININGPCNAPPRLTSHQSQGIKFRPPQIETYEVTIEQPVTPANASSIIETLKRSDGLVRFRFNGVQLAGAVTLERGDVVVLQNCYLDRTSRGTVGMGICVKGPMDITSNGLIGRSDSCFVPLDAQGRPLPVTQ